MPISRPGFLNKDLYKAFLGGNKYISCHDYVLLDAYCCRFLHSFYILVSSVFRERGELCHGPTVEDPLEKSETDSKGKNLFRDYYVLGRKIDKTGIDSKLKIFSFIIRSSVVSIKSRFDQMSLRLSVVRSVSF